MENNLFNQTLMKKYSKDFKSTVSKYELVEEWVSKLDKGDLEAERSNHPVFQNIILIGLLGYTLDDIEYEKKEDEGLGHSDFVLKSNSNDFMVIELKGQKVDLDKKQMGRSDNKSPVEQASGYAKNTNADWIFVSNYNEFRLYNYHERNKFISFKAVELLNKETFKYFMLLFSKKSHINSNLTNKLLDKTLLIEKELEKEFYKLYNETRLMLIKEFEEINDFDRLKSIHYAQIILNRYIFICFAEDKGLLPSQISADTIATPIKKGNLRHGSIWQRLNELFRDINEGNEFKHISEYNGRLFYENLDFIHIRDLVDDQSFFDDTYQKWNFEEHEKDIRHLLGSVGDRINPIYRNMRTS